MSEQLLDEVRSVLQDAEAHYPPGGPAHVRIAAASAHIDAPLMVAFAGKVKAGKSTLLNALVGERLAPTDAGECTRLVSMYQRALTYGVTARMQNGSVVPVPFDRSAGGLELELSSIASADVDRLVIDWPSSSLEGLTLIDTPGIASLSADASSRAMHFLAPDDERATEADAVIYLMRHLHASDHQFLEAFHDQAHAQATPVNTVAVLSRADEIGVGRLDAMLSARRIAARYRADPQIRRLCQTVLPVAGLIAEAAGTLRQDEYQAFATLAAAERERLDMLLISVDRFATTEDGCGLLPSEREHLLMRFGMYGVRLSVSLIRHGVVNSASSLADELTKRSGLDDLRALLTTMFGERRSVLKARGALLKLSAVVSEFGDPTGAIMARVEEIHANAHEILELQLLNALRSRQVSFDEETTTRIERSIGASGSSPHARVGADPGEDVTPRALELINTWRTDENHPLTTADQRSALQVAIRSLEQIVAEQS